ncbi:MAG: HAD-IB family phosphatase [Candidatus Thermoplasmatota archaeon]|nr:HAD-IB family phosphatase [Candidatus Thermoplasmatota archaeon]
MTQLVAFDMDGVLADTESSWTYVHKHFGVNNDHSLRAYLDGEIDDQEFIRRDIGLWREKDPTLSMNAIRRILDDVPTMNGAEEAVAELRRRGVRTAIISAGIDLLAQRLAVELKMDMFFANGFVADCAGRLTGQGVLNVRLAEKGDKVRLVAELLDIGKEEIVSVGNSRFDTPMFDASEIGIAFCPIDEEVREKADIVVEEKDLRIILESI